jgi:hypothetical protein
MTFELEQLGPYRIERSEEYGECPDGDRTYCELIRVRGSRVKPPVFSVVSHLYKFSETELALYMKDHKNLWRALSKLLREDIDITDEEIILRFSISKFGDVARIVPFIRKKTRKKPLSVEERERASHLREKRKDIMKQNNSISEGKEPKRDNSHTPSSRLEDFIEGDDHD